MKGQRRSNVAKQSPQGCLGRMVNLFDFGTVGSGKKLLTHKPHFHDHGLIKSVQNRFDVQNEVGGVNGTPMKKLLAEEMSKEMELNSSTNLVAKLMGLDSFPQPNALARSSKPRLKRSLSHGEYKDVYEFSNGVVEGLSKKRMEIVREKFLEAKRLVTDDKLRHSKEFQGAMEVLSSNKELFLEFLQESNSFFSHHLHGFQSTAPPCAEKPKRITILKPTKNIEDETAVDSSRDERKSVKGLPLFDWQVEQGYPSKQPSRIVVLKPNSNVTKASSCPTSPRGLDFEERESKEVSRGLKRQMHKEETLHSSVFSNGYTGDDSSLNRSINDYADSEIMSPISWDYINKFDSPFPSSPFSKASESSSVCREAKKRLSERWALMAASNENVQEETEVVEKKGGSTSTLGDMLALSDLRTEEEEGFDRNEEEDPRRSGSCLAGSFSREQGSLTRSRSLPESSRSLGYQSPDTINGKSEVLTKSKSLKWSLKGKVSSFLFSRNKKTNKERSHEESQVANLEILDSSQCSSLPARSIVSREEDSNEWHDEPSSISVLETSLDDDDGIFFNSSILNRSSSSLEPEMMSLRSNSLGKSPPIGSIGRTFSFDDTTVARCYSSKRSTTSSREEEEDLRLLINTLLSASDLNEDLLSKWHSSESPLDPSLRNSYAESTELGSSVKKLVFDLVNTLLLELTPSYLGQRNALCCKTLHGYLIERMQECLNGNGRVENRWWDEDGDLSSLAVNQVVRVEVAEIGSPESLRLEMDSIGEELELKLLEELVEETLMDLSKQGKVLVSSVC